MTPYIGEIRAFAGNFAPYGWQLCSGQLISISANEVLFTLVGTTYGGDGVTTFGLPDLRGKALVNQGQAPGLTNRTLGQAGGTETVTLLLSNLPQHNHNVNASTNPANSKSPTNNFLAAPVDSTTPTTTMRTFLPQTSTPPPTPVALDQTTIIAMGGSQPHENMIPIVTISYIISMQGIYPSSN